MFGHKNQKFIVIYQAYENSINYLLAVLLILVFQIPLNSIDKEQIIK